jgi:hypothetical protein
VRHFWIDIAPGLLFAMLVIVVGWIVDSKVTRREHEVRCPFAALNVGALAIGMSVFFVAAGLRANSTSMPDAWAWFSLVVASAAAGGAFIAMFFRWRLWADTDGLRLRKTFGEELFVPWAAIKGITSSFGSIQFDAQPIGRFSADRHCRGLSELFDFAVTRGLAVSGQVKTAVAIPGSPSWTYAFGPLGVLIGELVGKSKTRSLD